MLDWHGAPMLQRLIERVSSSSKSDGVVVATSDTLADEVIETFCQRIGVDCFRGSENHVLQRFVKTAQAFNASIVVRLTCDNPFVHSELVDYAVAEFLKQYPEIDYVSNTDSLGFPYGLFVEVIKASTFKRLYAKMQIQRRRSMSLFGYETTLKIFTSGSCLLIGFIPTSLFLWILKMM